MGHSESGGKSSLRYLTVQDMLWINLQVTKKVNHFNYARLEEAVFYQYGYGQSHDLLKQAAQFASGFVKLHPFAAGNEASAFVGLAVFLAINGMRIKLSDSEAVEAFEKISEGGPTGLDRLRLATESVPDCHEELAPNIEARAEALLAAYPATIAALASAK